MKVPLPTGEADQRKRLLSIILGITILASLVLGFVNVHLASWLSAQALFGLAFVSVLLLWLKAKDYYVLTSSLLVLSVLLVAHINLFEGRGLQDPGLLAYPLVTCLGTLLLGWRAGLVSLIAAAVSLAAIGLRDPALGSAAYKVPNFNDFLVLLTLLSVSTVITWLIIEQMEERTAALRASEERLQRANQTLELRVAERTALAGKRAEQLRMLAVEFLRAEQNERQRIADILHEHFQQLLAGARFSLSTVRAKDAGSREALQKTDGVLTEALETSRSLAVELSPPLLRHYGLAPSLSWLSDWMLNKHGLEVEVVAETDAKLPAEVQTFLFHAARELLFNVIKHSGVNQAKVELQLEADQVVRLSVSDPGVGFLLSESEPGDPTGGRFGLFSIRERIEFLEGRMEILSDPGTGTCISLRVPLPTPAETVSTARVAFEEPVAVTAEKGPSAAEMSDSTAFRIQVLIADDHAMMTDGLSRLLEAQPDLEIVGHAEDGRQAVELAMHLRPDVIVMDISMPEVNGIEATRRILAELPDTRIIGLSMYADPNIAEEMLRAGAIDYVVKTAVADRLVAAIRDSVAIRG